MKAQDVQIKLQTIRSLANIKPGGIGSDVINSWIKSFQAIPGNEDQEDFDLTDLQKLVANHPEAFSNLSSNLIITGPTSSGKTLAAEMLMANHLARGQHPIGCIYAVPLRALATEKWERFIEIFGEHRVYVSSSDYQENDAYILHRGFRIVVVVYEKLYRWLINPDTSAHILSRSGMLIVDELHMLTDHERGAKLELLLACIRNDQRRRSRAYGQPNKIRIVGLGPSRSALEDVAEWLDASLISLDDELGANRPVPLVEGYVPLDGKPRLQPIPTKLLEKLPGGNLELPVLPPGNRNKDELIQNFIKEVLFSTQSERTEVGTGKRILVYCASKEGAERVALSIAATLGARRQKLDAETERAMEDLEVTGALDILKRTIPSGVGFHHGDLTLGERKLVERLFRRIGQGTKLDVVVCTPTLAMGVNLPADYMIFTTTDTYRQSEWFYKIVEPQPLTPLEYKNFAGRAGRYRPNMPADHHGVALFLTDLDEEAADRDIVDGLIKNPIVPIEPALHRWPYGMAPLALAALVWEDTHHLAQLTEQYVKGVFSRTFAGHKKVTVAEEAIMPDKIVSTENGDMPVGSESQNSEFDNSPPQYDGRRMTFEQAAVESVKALATSHPVLVEEEKPHFKIQAAGLVVAQTGIHIKTFDILSHIAYQLPGILQQPFALLEELVQAPEIIRLYPTRIPRGDAPFIVRQLREFFRTQLNEGYKLGPISKKQLEKNYVPDDDSIKYMMRTVALWLWMQGSSAEELRSNGMLPDVRYGAVAMLADQLAWLVSALPDVWKALEFPGIEDVPNVQSLAQQKEWAALRKWDIDRLERRIRYGVPEGLEPLAQLGVRGWHRQRLVRLWRELPKWSHPVELLDYPSSSVEPDLRALFSQLKERIRSLEWIDDPRGSAERQVSLVRQSINNAKKNVDPMWPRIIASLYIANGRMLVQTVAEALTAKPLEMPAETASRTKHSWPPDLIIPLPGPRYIGVHVVRSESGEVNWADILPITSRSGPNGEPLTRFILISADPISQFDDDLRNYDKPMALLSREAVAQLCARAVDDPEDMATASRERRIPARERVRVLLENYHGILRTAADVDAEIDRSGLDVRIVGAQAGRGRVTSGPTQILQAIGDAASEEHDYQELARGRAAVIRSALKSIEIDLDLFPNDSEEDVSLVERLRTVAHLIPSDPGAASKESLMITELVLGRAYRFEYQKDPPANLGLAGLVAELENVDVLIGSVRSHLQIIVSSANSETEIDTAHVASMTALYSLVEVAKWYVGRKSNFRRGLRSVTDPRVIITEDLCDLVTLDPFHSCEIGSGDVLRDIKDAVSKHLHKRCNLNPGCEDMLNTAEIHPIVRQILSANWDPEAQHDIEFCCRQLKGWMRGLSANLTPTWLFADIICSFDPKKQAKHTTEAPQSDRDEVYYVRAPLRDMLRFVKALLRPEHGVRYDEQELTVEISFGEEIARIIITGGPNKILPRASDHQGQLPAIQRKLEEWSAKTIAKPLSLDAKYDPQFGRTVHINLPLKLV